MAVFRNSHALWVCLCIPKEFNLHRNADLEGEERDTETGKRVGPCGGIERVMYSTESLQEGLTD